MTTRTAADERAYRARKVHSRIECFECKEKGIAVRFLDTRGGHRMLAMHMKSWHK
jgi:hypothetical protein